MRSRLALTLMAAALTTALALGGTPADAAAKPKTPDKITYAWSSPGPGVGQITIRWNTRGRNTTSFAVETALTTFSKQVSSPLPWTGRHAKVFTVSGKKRSITLSANQVGAAGAAPKSGNHLFYRVTARNSSKGKTTSREFGKLKAAVPRGNVPKSKGTKLRLASYNVRSAKSPASVRSWSRRGPEVASQIKNWDPDVVALQELSPGRADGRSGATTKAVPRQTEALLAQLKRTGRGKYKLVRTTSYVKPGTKHGSQAARILYDSSTLSLLSRCPNKTGSRQYNTSCSFNLPARKGESKSRVRSAAYAEFKNKRTGKKFLFVSVHLDYRQSGRLSTRKSYNRLREAQMRAVHAKIAKVRHGREPVIVAGDYNSWQNNPAGNAPHDYLVSKGYYDTAAAQRKVNLTYPTYNNFVRTQTASPQGYGNRLDQILMNGAKGAYSFTNIVTRVDATRPSDHNMVVTDVSL